MASKFQHYKLHGLLLPVFVPVSICVIFAIVALLLRSSLFGQSLKLR